MKRYNRRLFIYFLLIKKHLFVISNDHKSLTSKFEVTDKNIRSLSFAELKAIKIIQSCIFNEQLDVAKKYVELLYQRYPYSTIINRLRLLEIDDLRYKNKLPFLINDKILEDGTSILSESDIDIVDPSKSDIKSVREYWRFFKNYKYEINN